MDVLLSVKIQKKENNNTFSLIANFMELRKNIQQIVRYMLILIEKKIVFLIVDHVGIIITVWRKCLSIQNSIS